MGAILAIADLPVLAQSWLDPHRSDFVQFYAAAHLGLTAGWRSIYDGPRLVAMEAAVGGHPIGAFPYPPPMAWLAVPATVVPFTAVAGPASLVMLGLALAACWWATEGLPTRARAALLVGAIGFYPLALAAGIGQSTCVVLAALSGSAALLRRGRHVGGGAALSLLAVKPHLGLASVPALALAGRWRAALTASGLVVALAGLSLLAIGLDGARALVTTTFSYGAGSAFSFGTLPVSLPLPLLVPAAAAVIVLAAAASWWSRQGSADLAIAAGILAGTMLFPHLLIYDYSLIFLAGLLLLRTSQTPAVLALLAAGYVLLELSNLALIWWAFPVVLPVEAALLLAIAWTARELRTAADR